ncbi:Uncharacterised protein [Candidatus Gugararchaeum adminiculabundum]|nr:Uncharacterised protein [Candidatus Gugararchaeum adminiculabundum]
MKKILFAIFIIGIFLLYGCANQGAGEGKNSTVANGTNGNGMNNSTPPVVVPPEPAYDVRNDVPADFESALINASTVAVVMDLRNSNSAGNAAIIKCAAEVAKSMGSAGKNVSNYAYEGNRCIHGDTALNETVADCENSMNADFKFIFVYGDIKTSFGNSSATISVNGAYNGTCEINVVPKDVPPKI